MSDRVKIYIWCNYNVRTVTSKFARFNKFKFMINNKEKFESENQTGSFVCSSQKKKSNFYHVEKNIYFGMFKNVDIIYE